MAERIDSLSFQGFMSRIRRAVVTVCLLSLGVWIPRANAQGLTDAYADGSARELVRLARIHRATLDRRIERYETTAHERFTASLRAGIAERLLYRRETATHIRWERDGAVELVVLGMRELAPVASTTPAVPFDVSAEVLTLAFDPADPDMLFRLEGTEIGHPLKQGSEAEYRFASGDTILIRMPDGGQVKLRELRVMPRTRRPDLFSGSLWLEAESHAVVRVLMRMARPFDADTDLVVPPEEMGLLGRALARQLIGLAKPIRINVDFLTIEYALWESTWWLPRLAVARGVVQLGRFQVPLAYERTYTDYAVSGHADGSLIARADSVQVSCLPAVRFVLEDSRNAPDTLRQGRADREAERRARAQGERAPTIACPREYVVVAAHDSVLLYSSALPPDPFGDEFELVTGADLRGVLELAAAMAGPPWRIGKPVFQLGLEGPGLTRYNRVEGLSTGARMMLEAGPMMFQPELRYGLADGQIRGEFVIETAGRSVDWQVSVYRRLRSAVRDQHVHGITSSAVAFLFAKDDHEYFDAHGTELLLRPSTTRRQWYEIQLFAERQAPTVRNTNFSVARLLGSDRSFRPNFPADHADQFGANIHLRHSLGKLPAKPRLDGELALRGQVGDFRFVQSEALLRTIVPLPYRLSIGLEAAAGSNDGESIPAQALFRLGGSSSLRGYRNASLPAGRYRRVRAEVAGQAHGVQYSAFLDAGRMAPPGETGPAELHRSWGVGTTQFGGLLRVDLARRFDGAGGWRLHVQVNREFDD